MRAALNPFSPGSGLRPPALVGRAAELDAIDVTVERVQNRLSSRGIVLSGLEVARIVMPAARRLGTHLDFVVVSRRGSATAPSSALPGTHRDDARDGSTYPRDLLRGVGKTVLLNEMRYRAEAAGWACATISRARMRRALDAPALSGRASRLTANQPRQVSARKHVSDRVKSALRTVSSFNLKLGTSGIDLGVEIVPGRADSGDIEIDLPELVQDLCAALHEEGKAFGLFIDEVQDLDSDLLRALLVTQHQEG